MLMEALGIDMVSGQQQIQSKQMLDRVLVIAFLATCLQCTVIDSCKLTFNNIHNGYRYTLIGSLNTESNQFIQQSFEMNHQDSDIDEIVQHTLKGESPNYNLEFGSLNNAVDYESTRLHLFNDIHRSVIFSIAHEGDEFESIIEFVERNVKIDNQEL